MVFSVSTSGSAVFPTLRRGVILQHEAAASWPQQELDVVDAAIGGLEDIVGVESSCSSHCL